MSTTTNNPLARLLIEAQQILVPATQPRANKAIAIERLAALLCTPAAHLDLLNAGAFDGLQRGAAAPSES
jgi:hypothetical protein